MGARFRTGLAGAITLLALAAVFGVIWAALSNLIAMLTRSAELTMALGFLLTLPVLFVSSAFFPLRLQPAWLQRAADANPAAYVITRGPRGAGHVGAQGASRRRGGCPVAGAACRCRPRANPPVPGQRQADVGLDWLIPAGGLSCGRRSERSGSHAAERLSPRRTSVRARQSTTNSLLLHAGLTALFCMPVPDSRNVQRQAAAPPRACQRWAAALVAPGLLLQIHRRLAALQACNTNRVTLSSWKL